jgi:hypothetical protein
VGPARSTYPSSVTATTRRLVRAGTFSVLALTLAAGAHTAGGGRLPSVPALLALSVLTACLAFGYARFAPRTPVTLAVLGAGQYGLHEGFSLLSTADCTSSGGHHAVQMACGTTAHHDPSAGMLVTHVLATALTAVLLARGEQALRALADRLAQVLPILTTTRVPVRPELPRPTERTIRPRLVDAVVPVRRGPPAPVPATP